MLLITPAVQAVLGICTVLTILTRLVMPRARLSATVLVRATARTVSAKAIDAVLRCALWLVVGGTHRLCWACDYSEDEERGSDTCGCGNF